MEFGSLRVRLTAWYALTVALLLALFGFGAWFAMRASILEAVDHNLRIRIADVRDFVSQEGRPGREALVEELGEQSLLGLGGGLLELSDDSGNVLYRSKRLGEPLLAGTLPVEAGTIKATYTNVRKGGSFLRIASQSVTINGSAYTIRVAEPMREFEESMEEFEAALLISTPVLLLLASFGGFWMSGRALSPVDRITSDARLITISNLSERLQIPRARDELQRLAITLNAMLDRIDSAVKRIVQFTADASHELRAPLTLIQAAAEFSLRRERTHEELVDAMKKIERESTRTGQLLDDLLTLARADARAGLTGMVTLDLSLVASEAFERIELVAESKQIQVRFIKADRPVVVRGESDALARLLFILLDNAVKYTASGGSVSLQLSVSDGHAEVAIADTGIGIAPDDLPHIYERFWRTDKVRTRQMGGAGLGLSIARWIVDQHHGQIQAFSELQKGSRFVVRLPLAESAL